MKRLASLLTLAASVAFAIPLHISPPAVNGCSSPGYFFLTGNRDASERTPNAEQAKRQFCRVASF